MLEAYRAHVAERAALGISPLPLSKQQTAELVALLKNPPKGEEAFLVDLLTNRVPAGVDDAAKVKAEYLAKVAKGEEASHADLQGPRDGASGHDARRLQHQAADRASRLSGMRRARRRKR